MKKRRMILFYSGATSGSSLPERVLEKRKPGVMLTYYEMHEGKGDALKRLQRHVEKRRTKRDS